MDTKNRNIAKEITEDLTELCDTFGAGIPVETKFTVHDVKTVDTPYRFVSCRPEDRARFIVLCERETRSQSDQFQVILREAYERRGLDFETGQPAKELRAT